MTFQCFKCLLAVDFVLDAQLGSISQSDCQYLTFIGVKLQSATWLPTVTVCPEVVLSLSSIIWCFNCQIEKAVMRK